VKWLIASTTGMAAANRIDAMIKNAILGISTAKALGISKPTVGILNVDGARAAERALLDLQVSGYEIHWAESIREGGGLIMRGNDILRGACQVLVTDSLTGNILVKMLSSLTTGGNYETLGYGYGPGVEKIMIRLSASFHEHLVPRYRKCHRICCFHG